MDKDKLRNILDDDTRSIARNIASKDEAKELVDNPMVIWKATKFYRICCRKCQQKIAANSREGKRFDKNILCEWCKKIHRRFEDEL